MMKGIMIQGTSSDSGKSFVTTAICRVLANKGIKVAPFKSQNMSNNAYVTGLGEEMGRAQAVQSFAAKVEPQVEMNPILLKPRLDYSSEIVLLGHPIGDYSSQRLYREFTRDIGKEAIAKSLKTIEEEFDFIVIEGAGSPVEINLMDKEIVNMYVAREADVPVILVADIDRGGVFSQVVGTLALLSEEDRKRVKGVIINKFRGDITLFESGREWLENYTGVPIIGVLPFIHDLLIEQEDALSIDILRKENAPIKLGVLALSRISNLTDIEILRYEEDVDIKYVKWVRDLEGLDALIIPGTKSTTGDLSELLDKGFKSGISEFIASGKSVMGICGGYQMLSQSILDPEGIEGNVKSVEGFALLPMVTTFGSKIKEVAQVEGYDTISNEMIEGYEIHFGMSEIEYTSEISPLFNINGRNMGVRTRDMQITGSYLHHILNNDVFRTTWLNTLRSKKGISTKSVKNLKNIQEESYDRLASIFTETMNMDQLMEIMEL